MRIAVVLTRLLLLLYPSSFRREMGEALIRDVRRKSMERSSVWLIPLAASLLVNAVGAWAEMSSGALSTFLSDVRLGFRALARERLFALSVTVILAVGIGATVTMFSVLNGIVLRPLPYTRAGELVMLSTHRMQQNQFDGTSGANFVDWRRMNTTFAGMTVFGRTSVSQAVVTGTDAPYRVQEGRVGPGFFELLGTAPIVGRVFSTDEFDRGDRMVVLSEGLWQSQFARSTDAIGRTLSIGGDPYTIVGVMPHAFQLPTPDTKFWRPLSAVRSWQGAQRVRDGDNFEVIGRLKPAVHLDEARREMGVIAAQLRASYPENEGKDIRVERVVDLVIGKRTQRGLWLGFAAVLSLLAIACANAGGILAARATRRRHEFAVRAALGAGRARLVRQLLAETVSLWALASGLGLLIAIVLMKVIVSWGPTGLPRLDEVRLDLVAVAVAMIGGLVSVAVCGILPAIAASKADATAAFRSRDPVGASRQRFQQVLVTAQIAGAMTLVIVSLLLARSFMRVQAEDPGYPAEHLLIARIDRPASPRFFVEARERLERMPGVVAVGGITDFFIRRAGDQQVTIEGRAFADTEGRLPKLVMDSVTPGYFQAMAIDIIEGRDFDDRDLETSAAPVVIVNQALARRSWPGESAIGKRLVGGDVPPADGRWSTVVGVARDMRREGLDTAPILSAFMPRLLQSMDLTIRTSTTPAGLISAVRSELRAIDRTLPVTSVVAADARLDERLGSRRFETQALSAFAVLALVLAAAGLYTSLAYQVILRTREIGVRSALGAERGAIVRMFVVKGLRTALLGGALGIAGAASVTRIIQGLLYDTSAVSPGTYLGGLVLVMAVALGASWAPARRAARVNPVTVLRDG